MAANLVAANLVARYRTTPLRELTGYARTQEISLLPRRVPIAVKRYVIAGSFGDDGCFLLGTANDSPLPRLLFAQACN